MNISGAVTVAQPVDAVWDAILDPAVLVQTIPGCSRLETLSSTPGAETSYAMTVTAGVAAIKGTYDGTATLSDLVPGKSLRMRLSGAGAPGTVDATVSVSFAEVEGGTSISYDADAIVGGMVGGVGQRMLSSVSKKMAGQFFAAVGEAIATPRVGRSAGPESAESAEVLAPGGAESAQVPGQPARATYVRDSGPALVPTRQAFYEGIAIGAGLVLLGMAAGRLLGRR
ncbi:SRPBCC family protein [Nocardioides sp.]|uniref:SRPBCC family protein n=1 Tax=Nocardioides sp. TaxID=35761 RepID=UPI0039E603A2